MMNRDDSFIERTVIKVRKVLSDKVTPGYDWYVSIQRDGPFKPFPYLWVLEVPQSAAYPYRNVKIAIARSEPLSDVIEEMVMLDIRYVEDGVSHAEQWVQIDTREVMIGKRGCFWG